MTIMKAFVVGSHTSVGDDRRPRDVSPTREFRTMLVGLVHGRGLAIAPT